MILKEIGKLCRAKNMIHMVRSDDKACEQWIGDGSSLYFVGGLRIGSVGDLMCIFDYKEKLKDNMQLHEAKDSSTLNLYDEDMREMPAALSTVTVTMQGLELVPAFAGGTMILVNARHLRPLRDAENPAYFIRNSPIGQYLAVKDGLFLEAVILPTIPADDGLYNEIQKIARYMELTADRETEEETEEEDSR